MRKHVTICRVKRGKQIMNERKRLLQKINSVEIEMLNQQIEENKHERHLEAWLSRNVILLGAATLAVVFLAAKTNKIHYIPRIAKGVSKYLLPLV